MSSTARERSGTIESAQDRFWNKTELEQMVQWLEEPSNQAMLKRGSGYTKKAALASLVSRLPGRTSQQVVDKYNNTKRSYTKAAQMTDQSGCGLTENDLAEGKTTTRSKLLSVCPFFFRLDAIWGNRPDIRPPMMFKSDADNSALHRVLDVAIWRAGGRAPPSRSSAPLGKKRSYSASKGGRRGILYRPLRLSNSESEVECDEAPKHKKKKSNPTIVDAIVELSAARVKSDQRKYGLLEKHLSAQMEKGDEQPSVRKEEHEEQEKNEKEFELLMRRLEVEHKKAEAEVLRYQVLLAQLQGGRSDMPL